MQKAFKYILILFGILALMAAVLLGCFIYIVDYKVTAVDSAQSEDGVYEIFLQEIGEPAFPFGSASGKLILKKGKTTISKTDFRIANDGGFIHEGDWSLSWHEDYVAVTLSGDEQYDELVILYYDGQVERQRLTTHRGEPDNTVRETSEDVTNTEKEEEEPFPEYPQIQEGYQAIYTLFSGKSPEEFEVFYGASESSSRCILFEDENTVDYLVYRSRSANGKCGLYVRYQNKKNNDGTWSGAEGIMVDLYAYVYESGNVISSGKTGWDEIGSETYREATGEE